MCYKNKIPKEEVNFYSWFPFANKNDNLYPHYTSWI